MDIRKITEISRQKIINKSVNPLPNNPAKEGYRANDVKKAMFSFVTDEEDSIVAEVNRIVDEINNGIDEVSSSVDKVVEDVEASKKYTDTAIANLVNSAPAEMDTLKELADAMQENEDVVEALNSAIGNKVDRSELPTKTSDLTNDSGYITSDDVIVEETDPTVPNYIKAITEEDIANWNNKSNFSGDYNDLTNKPNFNNYVTTHTQQTINAPKTFYHLGELDYQGRPYGNVSVKIGDVYSKFDESVSRQKNFPAIEITTTNLLTLEDVVNTVTLQEKSGTIALLEDLEGAGGGLVIRRWTD